MGQGPALLMPPGWFAQLDIELESEPLRAFYETLASALTVIRYDRLGTGLSDRDRSADSFTLDAEVQVSEFLLDALALKRCSLFGFSYGACVAVALAGRRPELVDKMILYGSYANGMRIASPAVQQSLMSMLRASWGLVSRIMTDLFIADGDPEIVRWFTHLQRESCTGDMAAALLEWSLVVSRLRAQAAVAAAPGSTPAAWIISNTFQPPVRLRA
jgi:pimeloyl-ACP methyl ester carboxylesterase